MLGPSAEMRRLLEAAVAAQGAGRLEEAESICRQILADDPKSLPAKHLLAMVAAKTGKTGIAIDLLREVVSEDRKGFVALNQLAVLLRGEGLFAEAASMCRRALAIKSDDAATAENLGQCLLASNQFGEAADAFAKAARLKPNLASAQFGLGNALARQGKNSEAIAAFERATILEPGHADAHAALGRALINHGSRPKAAEHFRKAAAASKDRSFAEIQLARLDLDEGNAAAAKDRLERAIARAPNSADLEAVLGNALQQLGDFDGAIAAYHRVLALQPKRTASMLGIISAKKTTEADLPLVDRMTSLLKDSTLDEEQRSHLHYALGKAFDDLGRYQAAMGHYDEANKIMAKRLKLSGRLLGRKEHAAGIDDIISTYTSDFFYKNRWLGSDSDLPILILGMMRSGTTLVEQIISSHPAVGAGDEQHFWGDQGGLLKPAAAGALGPDVAQRVTGEYLALLRAIAPGARHVTDKMPSNFLFIGLIHLFFPRARIVHCRRHPIDNALSIYATPYAVSPNFAHDRANIVFFYREYLRLMEHWRKVLPADRFIEVEYEDLIGDREAVTRRLIAFCGLEWNDACLRHENNTRSVKTASMWQARQPLYASSVARWRKFEPWLGEFRALVEDERTVP